MASKQGPIQTSETKKTKNTKEGLTVMEPAQRPDGSPLTPVWWEAADGTLRGPCPVTDVAEIDGRFWLVVQDREGIAWVHESLLRRRLEGERNAPKTDVSKDRSGVQNEQHDAQQSFPETSVDF
jgi:hypothetical protein